MARLTREERATARELRASEELLRRAVERCPLKRRSAGNPIITAAELHGRKRRSKYGAETVKRAGGGRFRSKKEAEAWADTLLALRAKAIDFAALWPVFDLAGARAEYDILEGWLIEAEPVGRGWVRAWVRIKDAKGARTAAFRRNKKQTMALHGIYILEV